jgi:hypothetical protein
VGKSIFDLVYYTKEDIAWLGFINNLHFRNRFFNDKEHTFYHIKELFDNSRIILNQGELLYRARKIKLNEHEKLGIEKDFNGFCKKDSFVPLVNDTVANRANSAGIPCLYAAKEVDTAVAEMRPYKLSNLSIATIKIKKDIKLFDLYYDLNTEYLEPDSKPKLWFYIANRFSIPYEDTSKNEYLLTQCISEFLRLEEFDGIQYASSLNHGGKNIAIFNCKNEDDYGNYDICEPISSQVRTIESITYKLFD